jgi:xylan 1,4-beta-xylosidase
MKTDRQSAARARSSLVSIKRSSLVSITRTSCDRTTRASSDRLGHASSDSPGRAPLDAFKRASFDSIRRAGFVSPDRAAFVSMWRVALVSLLCLAAAAGARAQGQGAYTNPVAAGDYPDPSVVRVGADYWATSTTSEWAPEFNILHSRDLINWEIVGSVFRTRPAWSVGSYWASEISHWRNRFYIYYSARKRDGPLCVAVATSRRAAGPYTDHGPLVCQEVGSIDGFPVTDERGRRFLLWKEDGNSRGRPTPIWAQQLSPDGTRLLGPRQELLRNDQPWEKHAHLPYGDLVEGPAVVRRQGWFYMFYSGNFCCARECNYMVGVARARRLLGPWEKNPANPILAGNDAWKCPGHGTVVSDSAGRDWLLYHAMDAKDFVYVGRQAMLDEVVWDARTGWPTINGGRGPSTRARSPHGNGERNAEYSFADEFAGARLAPGWQWPVDNEPVVRFEGRRRGWLVLSPARGRGTHPLGAVVARPTTLGDYTATTVLDARTLARGASAGIAAYGDADNAVGVSLREGSLFIWRRRIHDQRSDHQELTTTDAPRRGSIHLRMTAREGRFYRFEASGDGRTWSNVGGELDGTHLPPWDRGVRVALFAGGAEGARARFDRLRIEPARRPLSARR